MILKMQSCAFSLNMDFLNAMREGLKYYAPVESFLRECNEMSRLQLLLISVSHRVFTGEDVIEYNRAVRVLGTGEYRYPLARSVH